MGDSPIADEDLEFKVKEREQGLKVLTLQANAVNYKI